VLSIDQTLSASLRQVADTETLQRIGPPQRSLRDLVFCQGSSTVYWYDTSATDPGTQDIAPMDGPGLWRVLATPPAAVAAEAVTFDPPESGPMSTAGNVQEALQAANLVLLGGVEQPANDTLTETGLYATALSFAGADLSIGQVYEFEAIQALAALSGGTFTTELVIGDTPTRIAMLRAWTPSDLGNPATIAMHAFVTVCETGGGSVGFYVNGTSTGAEADAGAPAASQRPVIGLVQVDLDGASALPVGVYVQTDEGETCDAQLLQLRWRRVQ